MLLVLAAVLLLPALPATAITLTDMNSVVNINPAAQSGVADWIVDRTDQLTSQWFWYRLGTSAEASIETISAASVTFLTPRTVTLTYANGAGTLSIAVTYLLTGQVAGSQASDLAETINITNNTGQVLNFFQYSDFDLGNTPANDSVTMLTPNLVHQEDAGFSINETSAVPIPNAVELAAFNNTLLKLNNGVADNLNGSTSAGPGDVTWAFQWTFASGASYQISKDKQLRASVVPEPMTILGVMLSLGGVAGYIRRRVA